MNFSLNTMQRVMFFIAALILALLLFAQIEEYGLGESNWIIGSLIILALSLIAISGRRSEEQIPVPIPPSGKPEFDRLSPVVADALEDAKTQFHSQFKKLFEQSTPAGIKIVESGMPIVDSSAFAAWKAAYMIVLLSLSKRQSGYENSREADQLMTMTAAKVAVATEKMRAEIEGSDINRVSLDSERGKQYLLEIVQCRLRVMKTMSLLARNAEFPLDPIFGLISKDFAWGGSTPIEREQSFGPLARNIMRELSR